MYMYKLCSSSGQKVLFCIFQTCVPFWRLMEASFCVRILQHYCLSLLNIWLHFYYSMELLLFCDEWTVGEEREQQYGNHNTVIHFRFNVLTTRLGGKVEDSNFKKVNAFKTRQSDFTEGNYCILLVKQLTSLQDETTGMPENPTDVS